MTDESVPLSERVTYAKAKPTDRAEGIPRYIAVHWSNVDQALEVLDAHITEVYKEVPFEVRYFNAGGCTMAAIRSADTDFYFGIGENGKLFDSGIKNQILDMDRDIPFKGIRGVASGQSMIGAAISDPKSLVPEGAEEQMPGTVEIEYSKTQDKGRLSDLGEQAKEALQGMVQSVADWFHGY